MTCCVIVWMVACCSIGSDADTLTVEELASALEDVGTALDTYEVTCHFKSRLIGEPIEDGKYVDETATVTYKVSGDRVRCESRTSREGESTMAEATSVFTGEKTLSVKHGARQGRIGPGSQGAFFQGRNPQNFLTHVWDTAAPSYLRQREVAIKDATWDGHSVIAVETQPSQNEGREWQTQVLISPRLGYAIVRTAKRLRFTGESEWIEFGVVEMRDHVQDASGIWLPTRALIEGYTAPNEPGVVPLLIQRCEVRLENWRVGVEFPETTFALEFPPGTVVTDRVAGRTFKTAAVSDQMIADQATVGKELSEFARPDSMRRWWAMLVLGGTLAAAAIFLLVRRFM